MSRIARGRFSATKENAIATARKPYDTALRFISESSMPAPEESELHGKFAELKRQLELLGDVLEDRTT